MNIYYLKRLRGETIFRESKLKKLQIILVVNYYLGLLILRIPKPGTTMRLSYTLSVIGKKPNGLPALAKKGEAICDNQLVNFFKDAKHENCSCLVV